MGEFLCSLFDSWSFTENLLPRLAYMRVLGDHRHELDGPLPSASGKAEGDDKERRNNAEPILIRELRAGMRDRDLRIAELEHSLSWRITAPIRALGTLYLRTFGAKKPGM
jgi:hypothetical protein